jgi:hypothetical protein
VRYVNRISPGYKDADKQENPNGDLIIWREILAACVSGSFKSAVLITNDVKSDWVYTPLTVTLPNKKIIAGSSEAARTVKLPKPDLIAEFEHHTGGSQLHILSIEAVIETLSSAQLYAHAAQDFRHLALAVRIDLARNPTGAVLQWFLNNPDIYSTAIRGVCYWSYSPSEVDMEEFRAWTIKKMKLSPAESEKVNWSVVFCELFL